MLASASITLFVSVSVWVQAPVRHARCSPRRRPVVAGLFDNLFGPPPSGDDAGKFVRHAELKTGCAPLGVLAAGFDEDALEVISDCVESVWRGPDGELAHVPIAVLAEDDFRRGVRLRDVLAQVSTRDSDIPARPAAPRVPLVLFSGFSAVQTSATVRAIRALGLVGGASRAPPMFGVVVPNALDKTLRVLCEEIEGDHLGLLQRRTEGE